MFASPPSKTGVRAGSILAIVLASLLVASMLGLALVKTVLVHHHQMQVIGRQQQCFWLAEAGIQRAVQKLAESPDYEGEKWEVSADALPDARPAVVTIEIGKVAGSDLARELRVEARFGGDPAWPNACRRELVVSVGEKSPASPDDSKNEPKDVDTVVGPSVVGRSPESVVGRSPESVAGRSPDRSTARLGGSGDRPQLSLWFEKTGKMPVLRQSTIASL